MIILSLLLIWGYLGLLFYILMTLELDNRLVKEDMKFRYVVYSFLFGLLMILFYLEARNTHD